MPSKIEKFLRKLGSKGRAELEIILSRIVAGDFESLDIKKLGGIDNRYRVRKGDIRIQFSLQNGKAVDIKIGWRNEGTYE